MSSQCWCLWSRMKLKFLPQHFPISAQKFTRPSFWSLELFCHLVLGVTPSGPSLWTLHKILRTHGWALGTKQTEMGAMIVSKLEATLNWKSSSEIHCEKRRKESWSCTMACFLEATFHLPFETQLIHYSNRDTLLVLVSSSLRRNCSSTTYL